MAKVSTIQKPFYQLSVEESVGILQTDPEKGLTEKEAQARLQKYGLNKLAEGKQRSLFFQFLDQFRDLMIVVLVVAALLSFYLKDMRGGFILLAIVMVNAIVEFYQEYKAEKKIIYKTFLINSVVTHSEKSAGRLLARKRWILREADFTFGPLHKRGGYCMGTRSANHTGGPDGGDGFRSHPPDGPTAKNWNCP